MLSHFPARDVEEPATKEFVRAELASLDRGLSVLIESTARSQTRWLVSAVLAGAGLLAAVDIFS